MGTGPRHPDRLPRRLRPRRGGRSGGVRDRRRALAARRRARQPARLAGDDGAQPRRRPHPTRPDTGGEDQAAGTREAETEHVDEIDETAIPDERLELIFTCCHPALSLEAQVALTLRTLGGLSTERIASAFLVPKETMAKRLVRAKQRSAPPASRSGCRPAHLLPDRLDAVLGGRLPDLQRGLRGPGRPGRRGDPAGRRARRADAGRARGPGPAGADAAQRRPARGAVRGRLGRAPTRPGPLALGRREDRRGASDAEARPGAGRPGPLRAPGCDRGAAPRRPAGLARDRGAVRRARRG